MVRHFLGILAVLFPGMSVGLFASVLCRRAGASASISFATVLLLFLVPFSRAILLDTSRGLQGVDHLRMGPLHLALHDIGLPAAYGNRSLSPTIVLGLGFLLSVAVLFPRLWRRERRANTVERAPEGFRERRFAPIGDRENPFSSLGNRIGRLHPTVSGLVLLLSAAFALGVFLVESDQGRCMVLSYLFGTILLLAVHWKISLEVPFPVSCLRQSGMLDLIRSTPLSHHSLHSGLVLPVGYPLLRNGFLLLSRNLVLLTAVTGNRSELSDHGVPTEFLIILHPGTRLILPVELLSLGIAGMWWGLRTGSPLRIPVILFLSHAVVPAVLFRHRRRNLRHVLSVRPDRHLARVPRHVLRPEPLLVPDPHPGVDRTRATALPLPPDRSVGGRIRFPCSTAPTISACRDESLIGRERIRGVVPATRFAAGWDLSFATDRARPKTPPDRGSARGRPGDEAPGAADGPEGIEPDGSAPPVAAIRRGRRGPSPSRARAKRTGHGPLDRQSPLNRNLRTIPARELRVFRRRCSSRRFPGEPDTGCWRVVDASATAAIDAELGGCRRRT